MTATFIREAPLRGLSMLPDVRGCRAYFFLTTFCCFLTGFLPAFLAGLFAGFTVGLWPAGFLTTGFVPGAGLATPDDGVKYAAWPDGHRPAVFASSALNAAAESFAM